MTEEKTQGTKYGQITAANLKEKVPTRQQEVLMSFMRLLPAHDVIETSMIYFMAFHTEAPDDVVEMSLDNFAYGVWDTRRLLVESKAAEEKKRKEEGEKESA